jgi:ribosomal-protein-alanine N-acetyltransferase
MKSRSEASPNSGDRRGGVRRRVHPPAPFEGQSAQGPSSRVHWQGRIPRLRCEEVTLREITTDDAASLRRHLADPVVLRHVATGSTSTAGLEQFARWARAQRKRGALICFVIVPIGQSEPVGLMQLWPLEPTAATAEWGVILGRRYWGTGLFAAASRLLFDFAFTSLRVRRLEARTTVLNHRANAALHKVGARAAGRLRHALQRGSVRSHAFLWSIRGTAVQRRRGARGER